MFKHLYSFSKLLRILEHVILNHYFQGLFLDKIDIGERACRVVPKSFKALSYLYLIFNCVIKDLLFIWLVTHVWTIQELMHEGITQIAINTKTSDCFHQIKFVFYHRETLFIAIKILNHLKEIFFF